MAYTPYETTERIKKIREEYLTSPVAMETDPYEDKEYRIFCTGDRWMTLGFLEGWAKHKNVLTARLRRSLAEAEELYASEPVFYEHELLAGHLYLPKHTPEEQKRYDELCDQFDENSIFPLHKYGAREDHIGLDFKKLLTIGIDGILEEIKAYAKENDSKWEDCYPNYEAVSKAEFYECCEAELTAVLDLARRYAEKAKELAEATPDANRKKELLRISDALFHVPAKPARNFFEAMQSVQFLLNTLFGLFPFGRPDRYFLPYYEKDLANGTITREDAQELVDNFCLALSTRVFSRAACGFIVGGQDKDGNLVENDLTYMFITALDHIRMSDPNGALAVNKNTSDEILHYAAEVLGKGVTHPAFYNDDLIINSLQKYGVSKEDAVEYIHTTCAEISVCGKSRGHTTPLIINLPSLLLETVRENAAYPDFDTFLKTYQKKLSGVMVTALKRYITQMMESGRNGTGSMRVSCFVDDCIKRGKSIYEGGEKYCFIQPISVGFATAVDSLYTIRELVFEKKELTLSDFLAITESNYEGHEDLWQYILNKIPHYGNDISSIDGFAGSFAKFLEDMLKEDGMPAKKHLIPGTFSYTNHAMLGRRCAATFDGRLANTAFSDGCSPTQGRDVSGPTAMINSLTSWNQEMFLGGMVVNVKFTKSTFNEEKRHLLVNLIRTFTEQGGIEMQINSVDRETLLDAVEHPENHGDLIVRIGGYSDYFVRLTEQMQQEVIARTQY